MDKNKLLSSKIVLLFVILISFGTVLGIAAYSLSVKKSLPVVVQPTVESTKEPEVKTTNETGQKKDEGKKDESIRSIYYYKQEYNPASFSVHKFNLESSVLSEKLYSKEINGQIMHSLGENNKYLFGAENKINILDISSGELQEIFSGNEKEGDVMDAAMSKDKNKIAYSLDTEPEKYMNKKAELWIYDLKTKQKNKIFDDILGLYTGMSVIGWGDSDRYIVLREMGGDAGAVWGNVIVVDAKSPYNMQKVSLERSFLTGSLSSNGNLWLFSECDKVTGVHPIEERAECEEGEQIKVYDFRTKETKSVYRNTTHDNNTFKGKLRIIFDFEWQNNDNIIFSISDGIYKLTLSTQAITELYKFDWNDPEEIFNQPTYLSFANNDFIVFERYNHYAGKWILDLESGRVTEMTDSGYFFQ